MTKKHVFVQSLFKNITFIGEFGMKETSLKIDIYCTPALVASGHAIYNFRQLQADTIANITIADPSGWT